MADMAEDKGARRVQPQGLAFVPRATAAAALEEDPGQPSQTYFAVHSRCRAKKIRRSTGGLDWMQSSFTAQSDGTYVGRIRTARQPTEVTFALGSLFELRGLLVSLLLYMLLIRLCLHDALPIFVEFRNLFLCYPHRIGTGLGRVTS